jgi:hypothetical protein
MCAFAVNCDQVFGAGVAIGSGSSAGFLGWFEAVMKISVEIEQRVCRSGVRGFREEAFDIVHCDEGCR